MNQTSYPELEQLQEFTREPMPFHNIRASDLELIEDNKIQVGYRNTKYVYHPTYLRVENTDGGIKREEYPEWENMVGDVWKSGMDWEIQEDFICVTMFSDTEYRYEAYWVLENITINNPNLYN